MNNVSKKSNKKMNFKKKLQENPILTENLYGMEESTYNSNNYRTHLLEQYKLYVEMADNISDKRAVTNGFFLTLHTLLGTTMIITKELIIDKYILIFIAFIGIFISIIWFYLIKTYRYLNSAKFEIINKIEEKLPVKGFTAEWNLLLSKHKHYKGFTKIEQFVPSLVGSVYVIIILIVFCFMQK